MYVCHSEGEWTRQNIEVIMLVGAKHTGLCQELQRCWVFHAQHFPRVYQEWSTTQRTSSQLDTTVEHLTPCRAQAPDELVCN